MNSIHGHEVMERIMAADRPMSRTEILDDIRETYGADARFHTCSAEGMTATELIDFISARSKLVGPEDAMTINRDEVCDH